MELASITNWMKKMLCTQLLTENYKQFQTLCKDFTEIANEKNLAKAHIQNFERKEYFLYEQFLIEWKIIFIALSDLPWMLLLLLRTYVTCVMGATLMLRWSMDEKAPYLPVFAVAYMIIIVFVCIKKGFTFTVATRYICFHVYGQRFSHLGPYHIKR